MSGVLILFEMMVGLLQVFGFNLNDLRLTRWLINVKIFLVVSLSCHCLRNGEQGLVKGRTRLMTRRIRRIKYTALLKASTTLSKGEYGMV